MAIAKVVFTTANALIVECLPVAGFVKKENLEHNDRTTNKTEPAESPKKHGETAGSNGKKVLPTDVATSQQIGCLT